MEFRKEDEKLSFIESLFEHEPHINVIDKDRLNDRIQQVFGILYESLVKSFGPGGAGTFVAQYPAYYNTKDGFTIMKNVAFDVKLDQVICDMVMDICSRLNFTVGDGTTTAVIATRSIYESYRDYEHKFKEMKLLPRDIMRRYGELKDEILKRIDSKAIPVRSDDPEVLAENIRNVVKISSNGNEEITNMICDLYKELKYPAITVNLSQEGKMKSKIVSGFNIDVSLTDKIYINNDNNTMVMNGANVLIFDHKVSKSTYENILKPLARESLNRGKHLVCIAPYYDEVALGGVIRNDLLAEHKKTGNVSLVLTVCKRVDGANKIKMDDLAMLLNTQMITVQTEDDIIESLSIGNHEILDLFNIDNREIEGLMVAYQVDSEHLRLAPYSKNNENKPYKYAENTLAIRLGYSDSIIIGLKDSTFAGFYYNEKDYQKYLNIAQAELREIQEKVKNVGSFSFDLVAKQERVFSLGMKTGIIEVGASSEISQKYLKDMVDDAVKAAASAFNNGVVMGCNVTLMKVLSDMMLDTNDELDRILLEILTRGFISVYKSVLDNVFRDKDIVFVDKIIEPDGCTITEEMANDILDVIRVNTPYKEFTMTREEIESTMSPHATGTTMQTIIIEHSVQSEEVLDVSTGEFSKQVVNSSETDKEILKATIDLLSLLITGNQMVIC